MSLQAARIAFPEVGGPRPWMFRLAMQMAFPLRLSPVLALEGAEASSGGSATAERRLQLL